MGRYGVLLIRGVGGEMGGEWWGEAPEGPEIASRRVRSFRRALVCKA
jgi:hypothetical protein